MKSLLLRRTSVYKYIPNNEKQMKIMMDSIGINSIDDLFDDIPEGIRLGRELDFDTAKSELEVTQILGKMASKNDSIANKTYFLGAGTYDHYIPSPVDHLTSRSEFYTAYTPYQPEISQGTLQCIFEYQTMISELTGLPVSNASMYDGATATVEAVMLALDKQKGNQVLIAETVHPEIKELVKTYMKFKGAEVLEIPSKDGVTDREALESMVSKDAVCVLMQSPNFYGYIENLEGMDAVTKANKALFILNSDPMSFGILKSPGDYGVDIAVGDAQCFGNAMNYGGPHIGYMACTEKLMRKMPGRIAGESEDLDGNRAFVLTLQAREQHIRREKASSNICSNQALCALKTTIYLSLMGKKGVTEAAEQCASKANYFYNRLLETGKFKSVSDAPFFKEFVLESTVDVEVLNDALYKAGIIGGLNLELLDAEKKNQVLLCVTEKRTLDEMNNFVQVVEGL